jgi:hypothetical protein
VKKPTDVGPNRTGIGSTPIDGKETILGARIGVPLARTDVPELDTDRKLWARDADPVGTMPPPTSLKGAGHTLVDILKGSDPLVLIDKLAERLAFERIATRLVDAVLVTLAAADVHAGGPTRADLERIRDDEHHHVLVLRNALERLGADPTAMTPGADVVGVVMEGLVQAATDPRTTLTQCLGVLLHAESADDQAWLILAELASHLGQDELEGLCRRAHAEEEDHLMRVRKWLTVTILGQAGVRPTWSLASAT